MPARNSLKEAQKKLTAIPYVGPRMAELMWEIGIEDMAQLAASDPVRMFQDILDIYGKMDRCVLYVFRQAVYYAKTENPDPELAKWWNWKD